MVQWIDLLPTLIEAAKGQVPPGLDGRSFQPVLRGSVIDHRDVIFTTHSGDGQMNVYPIRSVRTPDWKLILNLHPEFAHTTHIDKVLGQDRGLYWLSWFERAKSDPAAAAIVKRYHERPPIELYDLRNDPDEQRNLANDPRQEGRIQTLKTQLRNWMREQGDSEKVFNTPRLLSDPATVRPGDIAGSDEPGAAPSNPRPNP